jgi:hypothetical protein
MHIKQIISFIVSLYSLFDGRYVVTSCTRRWVAEASIGDTMPLITAKIRHGDAGRLGAYGIFSVLPDNFARFLFEFHSHRFESLDIPFLPADRTCHRSDFDVHAAPEDEQVRECLILNMLYSEHGQILLAPIGNIQIT